jgi:hypothetical protein
MAKKRVADLLVDVLAEAGVRRIFGVSGDSLNGITDSIRASRKLEWIHLRHEETAAFAAGAEAHLTGGFSPVQAPRSEHEGIVVRICVSSLRRPESSQPRMQGNRLAARLGFGVAEVIAHTGAPHVDLHHPTGCIALFLCIEF